PPPDRRSSSLRSLLPVVRRCCTYPNIDRLCTDDTNHPALRAGPGQEVYRVQTYREERGRSHRLEKPMNYPVVSGGQTYLFRRILECQTMESEALDRHIPTASRSAESASDSLYLC